MLRHPAFPPGHVRGDAEGEALLPEQGIAAIAGPVGPDQVLLGKMADVLLLDRGAWPRGVLLSRDKGSSDGMEAGNELSVRYEHIHHLRTDPGHDVHIAHDIGTVGQLNADLRDGRADGPHGKGNDVQGAALHAALVQPPHGLLELIGMHPVVRGAGLFLRARADVGAVLHAGHVAGIGTEQETVRPLLKRDRHAALLQERHHPVILLFCPVAPGDRVGPAEVSDLLHPAVQFFIP